LEPGWKPANFQYDRPFQGEANGGYDMRKWRSESVLDLYNLALAAVLFTSPWFFAHRNGTAVIDLRASSAAIAVMSLAAMFAVAYWEEWTNLLAGVWLIVSPWALGFTHTSAMHFSIAVGAAVAFLAAIELWLMYEAAHPEPAPRDPSPNHRI
jgi:hypothetical protein